MSEWSFFSVIGKLFIHSYIFMISCVYFVLLIYHDKHRILAYSDPMGRWGEGWGWEAWGWGVGGMGVGGGGGWGWEGVGGMGVGGGWGGGWGWEGGATRHEDSALLHL